jgi:hypothetical protein
MEPKKYKLDIFTTLQQINLKRVFFYNDLTDEERKGFQPLVTMRWMSGTKSSFQIILLNELVNPFVFSLSNHKELLYKLMTICATKPQHYSWLKMQDKQHKYKQSLSLISKQYGYSSTQAKEVFPLFSTEDILDMAETQGLQKEELVKLKAELKTR